MFSLSKSFTYLNITQFLGALNDNIFKLLIVFFLIQLEGIEHSQTILSATGAVFVMPFLLFSTFSGTLADRFSKRNIIVWTKALELVVMALGAISFAFENRFGAYATLFLMAAQSTLFGPSKFGIIPELVSSEKISKANGLLSSFSFLAIILGTFIASFLMDVITGSFVLAGVICILFALIGFFASLSIAYTPPAGSEKKASPDILYEIYLILKLAKKEPSLLAAVLGTGFFFFAASFVQLNIIPYAMQELGWTDKQGGYLFLLTALGIGAGSYLAGKISGKSVELGIVPLSAIALAISLCLLETTAPFAFWTIVLIPFLGLFGGMFEIPLEAYVQYASPNQERGKIVAASNFLSFFGVLLASILLFFMSSFLGLSPRDSFFYMGVFCLFVAAVFTLIFFDYLTRFICMILSKLHFNTHFRGKDELPSKPVIYICTHTAWNDTLLLLGAQERRIRFFIENEQEHTKWLLRLYRLLRVIRIPSIEPLYYNTICLQAIKASLIQDISVCIFIEDDNLEKEMEKLRSSTLFQEIVPTDVYPLVPVWIEKGEKEPRTSLWLKFLHKLRVPAVVSFG